MLDRKLEPVHRNSYDVQETRAKPWQQLGNGSTAQRNVFKNSLLRTLREHMCRQRCEAKEKGTTTEEGPILERYRQLRENAKAEAVRTGEEEKLATKLAELADEEAAALNKVWLLPRDLLVLEALFEHHNAATGELFPAQETIADEIGWSRSAVNESMQRLQELGYLSWVRRSIETGNARGEGPQRRQASNAYYFDWKARMSRHVWARFWQLVLAGLKRLTGHVGDQPPARPKRERQPSAELGDLLARVGALVPSPSQ